MNTLEKNLWKWLKTGKPKEIHAQRIENRIAQGTPDLEACGYGRTAWIELKVGGGKNPWSLKHLTAPQAMWHWERNRVGGTSWLLIQIGDGRLLFPGRAVTSLYHLTRQQPVTDGSLIALGGVVVYSAADTWGIALRRSGRDDPLR